jgi:hypothetical protein
VQSALGVPDADMVAIKVTDNRDRFYSTSDVVSALEYIITDLLEKGQHVDVIKCKSNVVLLQCMISPTEEQLKEAINDGSEGDETGNYTFQPSILEVGENEVTMIIRDVLDLQSSCMTTVAVLCSGVPSASPSSRPSASPSDQASASPSASAFPSALHSVSPSSWPSALRSASPSSWPSALPSASP